MWYGDKLSYSIESFFARLSLLKYFIYFFIGLIFLRLVFLQVIKGDQYRKRADDNRVVVYPQPATRGKIYDKNLDVIVDNKPSFVVLFSRQMLADSEVNNIIKQVSGMLAIPSEKLFEKLASAEVKNFTLIKLAENITKYQAMRLSEKIPQLPGIMVRVEPVRTYKWKNIAAHLTGYIQSATVDDLSKIPGLNSSSFIGKTGIEKQYDTELRGYDGGMLIEVTARGVQKKILGITEPQDGLSLVLTVDKGVQKALAENMEGYTGCAIAIDPNSGGILGLVSSPGYEPNSFINGIEDWRMSYFLNSKSRPLLNRALQCHYPPGSIFKMITATAGLENSLITPKDVVNCKGYIEIGKYNQRFRCWLKEGHGNIRLVDAITNSCDVYFYDVGLKLGPAKLNEWSKKFMLGEVTGVDLPYEVKGLIPDKSWKKSRLNQMWYDGDTVNMSVGQGYILVTPIQVAQYIATIANGGTIFQTHVLRKIIDANGNMVSENIPRIRSQLKIDPANIKVIKTGMLNAVRYGTARAAFLPELSIAGKTGTAQNPHGKNHAWFVCFAPYEKPKIALVVMVEHGGGGGEVAAPLAGKMLDEMFYGGFFE